MIVVFIEITKRDNLHYNFTAGIKAINADRIITVKIIIRYGNI